MRTTFLGCRPQAWSWRDARRPPSRWQAGSLEARSRWLAHKQLISGSSCNPEPQEALGWGRNWMRCSPRGGPASQRGVLDRRWTSEWPSAPEGVWPRAEWLSLGRHAEHLKREVFIPEGGSGHLSQHPPASPGAPASRGTGCVPRSELRSGRGEDRGSHARTASLLTLRQPHLRLRRKEWRQPMAQFSQARPCFLSPWPGGHPDKSPPTGLTEPRVCTCPDRLSKSSR